MIQGLRFTPWAARPEFFSARYAGGDADDRRNYEKTLKRDEICACSEKRGARFVCCIALAFPDGKVGTFSGYAEGMIGKEPKGANGFGYDPVFYPKGHERTFAEMSDKEKDLLSHRGAALGRLDAFLERGL